MFKSKHIQLFIAIVFSTLVGSVSYAQCNWTSIYSNSYESTAVIPYVIPGSVYQDIPQNYAGCVRTGNSGFYMNFVDGYTGLVYSQPFTNLCIGQNYRFSFSTRDAWSSTNNLQFTVKNSSGAIILTQNVNNTSVWNDITMASFTATSTSVTFEIATNMAGGPGNDAGFDDLRLSQCQPLPTNYTITQCAGGAAFNTYTTVQSVYSQNGAWTGPSLLTNGYQGTFTPGTNTNGVYNYTVNAGLGCADSIAQVTINMVTTPVINPIANVQACNSYVLPTITGTNLPGNQKYYTGPNGTGTPFNAGQTITTSQTLYAFAGSVGCSDQVSFTVTISTPLNAGADNGAFICGQGPMLNLNSYLSTNASNNGTWAETSSTSSGSFNTTSAVLNTNTTAPGSYTFTYTVPANGGCASDVAQFTISMGNLPSVNLGSDTTLCPNQTLVLNAAANGVFDSYKWNNNTTLPTRTVTTAGVYSVKAGKLGGNQIVNGDFEQGNTGFTTGYTLGTGGTWGPVSNPGTYSLASNPVNAHSNFTSCTDHTANPGNQMLVVNGSGTPGLNVWCQTVPVQANTDYQFGTWASNASNDFNVAQLQFSINGSNLGSQFTTQTIGCAWQQFFQVWNSGLNSSAQICLVNQNTNGGGNDFLIDDITFKPICYTFDTIVVSYSTFPIVNLGNDTTLCSGEVLTIDAQNPGSTYQWSNGTTNQTLTTGAAGQYTVTVTNTDNCSKSDNITITIENQKTAGLDSMAVWCETAGQVDLNALKSISTTAGGIWENSVGTINGFNATGIFSTVGNAGVHQVNYVVSGIYCANDTSHFQLTINEQSYAAANTQLHVCNTVGDQVDLNPLVASSTVVLPAYWQETSSTLTNQFDATTGLLNQGNLAAGNYTFAFVLPVDSMCVKDTAFVGIQITENPIINFTTDTQKGCFPLEVNLLNSSQSTQNSTVLWDLGDGTNVQNQNTVNHTYTGISCFDVSLTITADGLCTTSETRTNYICVDPLPVADFSYAPQQVYSIDPTVNFDNLSSLNNQNEWTFGDGESSFEENPTHLFPIGEIGNYTVELIVITTEGCRDTISKIIEIKDQLLVYVPNTFTPDGDEYNNIFLPILTAGFDPFSYTLQIYNRWGELVFESHDSATGWDGTYHGQMSMNGIYSWKIQFKSDSSDKKYNLGGNVNLLK